MKKIFAGMSLLGSMLLLAGCGSSNNTVAGAPSDNGVSLESLRSAPTQVAVGSGSYALTAYLYRNLQPTISLSGVAVAAPLNATFTVAGTSGNAVPAGLTVTSAYIVQNSNIGTLSNLSPKITASINAVSTLAVPAGSANYAPGTAAEVVVQLQSADGTTYLLQQPSVTISAAD